MRNQIVAWALCLGAVMGVGCWGGEESAEPSPQVARTGPVSVTLGSGETVQVDASKICWDTLTPIPPGHSLVADEKTHSLRFVPAPDKSVEGMFVQDEVADEGGGGGGITCTCTSGSGGCSPGKVGSNAACVMTSCSSCTKS